MRKLLSITVLFLCFVSLASAQSGFDVDPANQPVWFTKGTQWGRWTKSVHFPGISWRVACGDGFKLGNVVVYKQQTQVRNDYNGPTTLVWAVEAYNQQTGKNTFLNPMQQDFDASGKVSAVLTVLAGQCAGGQQTWIRLICATPVGQASKCYQSNGQPYAAREPDQLMPSADQKVAGGGVTNRSASSQAGSSAASSEPPPEAQPAPPGNIPAYWVCSAAFHKSEYDHWVVAHVFQRGIDKETETFGQSALTQAIFLQFGNWAKSTYKIDYDPDPRCGIYSTQQDAQRAFDQKTARQAIPATVQLEVVDWSPK